MKYRNKKIYEYDQNGQVAEVWVIQKTHEIT